MRALPAAALALAVGLGMASAGAAQLGPDSTRAARGDTSTAVMPYKMPPLSRALFDHMHNKLIHFPIVLTLVAAAMVIVARRKPELEPVAFWLVWAAALSVIPAYFSGKAAAEHLEGKPKEWLAEAHEKQAIAIGVLQALWVLSLLKTGSRRYAWVIGAVLAVLVLSAGFIGGLVAHGR